MLPVSIGVIYIFYNLYEQIKGTPPFISTRKYALPEISNALSLKEKSVVYDIGCGNGEVLRYLITNTPYEVRGVGIELNPFAFYIAKINTKNLPITIKKADALTIPLSEATHVYCYLLPEFIKKIEKKILDECRPGTRIVTCDFHFETIKPVQIIELKRKAFLSKTISLYIL